MQAANDSDSPQKLMADLANENPLEWRKTGPSSDVFCRFCGGKQGDRPPHFEKCVWNRARLLIAAAG